MTADDVVRFLQDHPTFFQEHPALLVDLLLPDPHQGNAVSLMERQTLLLRERVKGLESRLAELIRIGRDNDNLARNLVDWSKALLAESDRSQTARVAVTELKRIFAVPLAEIRIWELPPAAKDAGAARLVSTMRAPTCGTNFDVATIGGCAEEWSSARSVALVPLRLTEQSPAFGLIALGSADPERFQATLGTAVLSRIGELASVALASSPPSR